MKLVVRILCCGFIAYCFSCKPKPDVNPTSYIQADAALNTTSAINNALVGAYNAFADSNTFGGSFIAWGDVISDQIVINSGSPYQHQETNIYYRNFSPSDSMIIANYNMAYQTINRANAVIDAIDRNLATDANIAYYGKNYKGQALVLRALTYFYLLRFYAPQYNPSTSQALAVPLVLKPVASPDAPARATLDEVYNQIIADLTMAAPLLPAKYAVGDVDKNNNSVFGNITGDAARCLLAKVYFQRGIPDEYYTAIALIDQAIGGEDSSHVLSRKYSDVVGNFVTSPFIYPSRYPLFLSNDKSALRLTVLTDASRYASTAQLLPNSLSGKSNNYYEKIFQVINSSTVRVTSKAMAFRYSLGEKGSVYSNPRYFISPNYGFKYFDSELGTPVSDVFPNNIDLRFQAFTYQDAANPYSPRATRKYSFDAAKACGNICIIRSGDMVVTRAEMNLTLAQRILNANSADTAQAAPYIKRGITDFFFLRNRAKNLPRTSSPKNYSIAFDKLGYYLANKSKANVDTLVREIRKERIRELFTEGDRVHDLRRRGLEIPVGDRNTGRTILPTEAILPIPLNGASN